LKNYKLPGGDQIPAELIQAGGEILLSILFYLLWLSVTVSDTKL
jgi:hypothetical protein